MKSPEDMMRDARMALLRANRWLRRSERTMRAAIRASRNYELHLREQMADELSAAERAEADED